MKKNLSYQSFRYIYLDLKLTLTFTFFSFYLPWSEVATHFRILAWRIPWTEELCRLQSIVLQRVGHNWRDLAQHSMAQMGPNAMILIFLMLSFNPEYSLERLIPTLRLQYFGHLIRRANSLEKTLMLAKIERSKIGIIHLFSVSLI